MGLRWRLPLEVSLDDVLTGQPVDSFTTY